jgi:hypothetical protein
MHDGMLARIQSIASYDEQEQGRQTDAAIIDALRESVVQAGFRIPRALDADAVLGSQQWLGNQVTRVESGSSRMDSLALWSVAAGGGGLTCWGMSALLRDLIVISGGEARVVQLYRSNYEPNNTHVVVEVRLDGRWVVFDPTFNVTLHDEEARLLGVSEIRGRLATNPPEPVSIRYHGDRRYPGNLPDYYLDPLSLYANAFAYGDCSSCALWQRLPPFRYWFGPTRYMFGEGPGPLVRQHNRVYLLTTVLLPLSLAIPGGLILWSVLAGRGR